MVFWVSGLILIGVASDQSIWLCATNPMFGLASPSTPHANLDNPCTVEEQADNDLYHPFLGLNGGGRTRFEDQECFSEALCRISISDRLRLAFSVPRLSNVPIIYSICSLRI
jgi:hypothetical protein